MSQGQKIVSYIPQKGHGVFHLKPFSDDNFMPLWIGYRDLKNLLEKQFGLEYKDWYEIDEHPEKILFSSKQSCRPLLG
jgi:hypothetical protein